MSIGAGRAISYLPLGIYIFFAVLASTLAIPFRAQERFTPVAMSGVTEKASVLVALSGLVLASKLNALGFSIALAVGPIASCIQLALGLERRFRTASAATTHDIVAMWKAAKHFGLTGVASQVLRADVAIVAALSGATAAGIYAAPSRITLALVLLPAAFSITLFSRAARQTRGSVAELRPVLVTLVLVMLPVLIAIYIGAPAVVSTVLGSEYAASATVLRILLLMVLMNTVNQPLVAALQARGEDAFVAATLWTSAGLGLVGVTVGAAASGPNGAAFGVVAMQAMLTAALGWRVKSRLSAAGEEALPHETAYDFPRQQMKFPQLIRVAASATRWTVNNGPRGSGRILPPLIRRIHSPRSSATSIKATIEVASGLLVHVDTANTYERDLYFLGPRFFDPEVRALLPHLIRSGHSALDVGANIGIHAIVMAKASISGQVYAVEPVPANVERLRANIHLNGLNNITVIEAAASDHSGSITVHLPALGGAIQPYASAVPNREFLSTSRRIEVRASSVDELVAHYRIQALDLLKIDVEGFEPAVLRGAWSVLQNQHPVLIVEHHEGWWTNAGFDAGELRRDLHSIGYEDVFLTHRYRFPSRIPEGSELPAGNLLIVPISRRSSDDVSQPGTPFQVGDH
jgi:FkbM family methyltransferase